MGRGRQMSKWANNFGLYLLFFMTHFLRNVEAASGPWLTLPSARPTNGSHPITCELDQQHLHSSRNFCCNKCNPGYKMVKECEGPGRVTECKKCENGYLDSANYVDKCFKCSKCKDNEEETMKCSHKQNRVCQCKIGYFKFVLAKGEHECRSCKKCGTGEREKRPCELEKNTECECKPLHYRDRERPSTCKPCVECKEYEECKESCPSDTTTPKQHGTANPAESLIVAVPVTIVATSLLMVVVLLCYKVIKSRWTLEKKTPTSILEPPDSPCVSVTSSEPLIMESTMEYRETVPIALNDPQNALPYCVPPNKFIYSVLEVVPVSRITELVRLLGVKDQDIERARRDNPISCQEAQYHMLKRWADSRMRASSVTLSPQLLMQLLNTLREMGLGGCAESLEMDYNLDYA